MGFFNGLLAVHWNPIMLFAKLKYVVVLMVLASSSIASAGLIVPPGIQPGQQYRLAFVTSGTTTATSSDIATYNNFVTTQAGLVPGLNATTWTAIGSTLTVNARDNTGTNPSNPNHTSVPIFLLNGTRIANNNNDLWDGEVITPLQFTQYGAMLPGITFAHTGTIADGTGADNVFDLPGRLGNIIPLSPTDSRSWVMQGSPWVSNGNWIEAGHGFTTQSRHMYALSGVITAVPEPSSLLLVGLGTCGWSLVRRRRK